MMWFCYVSSRRLWELLYAFRGASVYEQGEHIPCRDPQRNPYLVRPVAGERSAAHAARGRRNFRRIARQARKRRPVLVVPVECPSADTAALQLPASGDFVWEPVEVVRSLRVEFFEAGHLTDFGRNSYQVASVESDLFHRLQFLDRGRQGYDLLPQFGSDSRPGTKFFASIGGDLLDVSFERQPCLAGCVLNLAMQLGLKPRAPLLRLALPLGPFRERGSHAATVRVLKHRIGQHFRIGVTSSCLCKNTEGAGFPFQIESLENGVDDPVHTAHVDEADHGPGASPYLDETAFNDIGGA